MSLAKNRSNICNVIVRQRLTRSAILNALLALSTLKHGETARPICGKNIKRMWIYWNVRFVPTKLLLQVRGNYLWLWVNVKGTMNWMILLFCLQFLLFLVKVWRHMRVHGRWRSKVLKRKHVNKENKDKGIIRWYTQKTCEICSRIFANSRTLSKHVKTVHNRIKPFICNVCGRKSARKSTWIVRITFFNLLLY